MLARIAEQNRAGPRAFEIEMGGMLPGEAHAAVNLDIFRGRVKVRLGAIRLGEVRALEDIFAIGDRKRSVIRGRSGEFGLDQHVSALVLDRLERADGTA